LQNVLKIFIFVLAAVLNLISPPESGEGAATPPPPHRQLTQADATTHFFSLYGRSGLPVSVDKCVMMSRAILANTTSKCGVFFFKKHTQYDMSNE
jgi:hypothetical protein